VDTVKMQEKEREKMYVATTFGLGVPACWFVIYLMRMSVTQTTQHQTTVWQWIMKWEWCGRKQSGSNLSTNPRICLKDWAKSLLHANTNKPSVRRVSIPVKIQNGHLINTVLWH
jgi:hypothetical protein